MYLNPETQNLEKLHINILDAISLGKLAMSNAGFKTIPLGNSILHQQMLSWICILLHLFSCLDENSLRSSTNSFLTVAPATNGGFLRFYSGQTSSWPKLNQLQASRAGSRVQNQDC